MAGVMDSVNQRTQLVGQNRLELLLFRLGGQQLYGINVFKVKEVLQCPQLNAIPGRSTVVRGVAHIRGGTLPIMDMNLAIGRREDHARGRRIQAVQQPQLSLRSVDVSPRIDLVCDRIRHRQQRTRLFAGFIRMRQHSGGFRQSCDPVRIVHEERHLAT